MTKRYKNIFYVVVTMMFSLLLFAGCSLGADVEKEKIHVVSSFSILHDIAINIGGDRIEADYLAPIGEDPHEFEPTPRTFTLISEADLLLFNGYNMDYWIQGLAENAESTAKEIIMTQGVSAIPLSAEAGDLAGMEDPHAWLDPKNVIIYAQNVAEALIEIDPEGAEIYQSNLDAYIAQLTELDQWILEQVNQIEASKRVVIISESAFKYFARGYGFEYDSIWEINAHEEGSPRQIERLVEKIKEEEIPAVFLETSVDPRPMERVASEAGIQIAGELYTDSLGNTNSGAATYIDMMKHNVETIVDGLTH